MKNLNKISIIFFLFIFNYNQTFSQAGALDPTFGNSGIVINDSFSAGNASAIQDDGKIVVVGTSFQPGIILWRFMPDGNLDNNFGTEGRARLNFDSHFNTGRALGIQNDGKIIVTGYYYPESGNGYNDIGIMRCDATGKIDSSFGSNGLVIIDIDIEDLVTSLKIQPDGKIAISGDVRESFYDQKRTFLLRLNSEGILDESFGDSGIVINNYNNATNNKALVIRPNGKLILCSDYNWNSDHSTFELQSFNIDGSVDESFGVNGKAKYIFGDGESGTWNTEMYDATLQQDGKIVCTGTSGKNNDISMALCRFNADGSVDQSFGVDGGIIVPYKNKEVDNRSIDVQTDGKIVTCGDIQDDPNPGTLIITRFLENGQLDLAFGKNGFAAFNDIGNYPAGKTVHCLPDGKTLISGNVELYTQILLVRLNGDNVLAANFKDIKAAQNNDAITITWQTLNESGTKSFSVERSMNANDYVGIGTVPAKGVASSYSYTDKNPLDGTNYYRIRENAINGTNTFSQVVKVLFNSTGAISLFPNPAKNTVTVKGLNKNITAIIKITDMQGREISSQNFTQSSSATLNIRALAGGTYFVQVAQEGKVVRLKLIRE